MQERIDCDGEQTSRVLLSSDLNSDRSEKNSEEEEKFLRKRGKSTIAPEPLELELRCVLGDWRGQRAREIETSENGLFPVLTKIQAKKPQISTEVSKYVS